MIDSRACCARDFYRKFNSLIKFNAKYQNALLVRSNGFQSTRDLQLVHCIGEDYLILILKVVKVCAGSSRSTDKQLEIKDEFCCNL